MSSLRTLTVVGDSRLESQIFSKSLYFIQKPVHVFLTNEGRENDHSEKVDPVSQRLVTEHHRTLFHHAFFDSGSHLWDKNTQSSGRFWCVGYVRNPTYLSQFFLVICISFLPSQTRWYIPETHIHKLRLFMEENSHKWNKNLFEKKKENKYCVWKMLSEPHTSRRSVKPSLFFICSTRYLKNNMMFCQTHTSAAHAPHLGWRTYCFTIDKM